jgi:hypothetical protein
MPSPIFFLVFGGLMVWALIRRMFIKLPKPASIDLAVIAEYRRIRLRQLAMSAPLALLVLWMAHGGKSAAWTGGGWPLMMLILVGVLWFNYRNWRCPKCGSYLGRYPGYKGVCPQCGTALLEPSRYQRDDLQ